MTALSTPVPAGSHSSATSTGTGNIQSQAAPAHAAKMFVTVLTTAARVTFDGTDPGAGAAPGIVLPAGFAGLLEFAPKGTSANPNTIVVKHASNAAGNSELSIVWLT